jgi:hypothetical protein
MEGRELELRRYSRVIEEKRDLRKTIFAMIGKER